MKAFGCDGVGWWVCCIAGVTRQDEILGQAQDDGLWGLPRGCWECLAGGVLSEEMLKRVQHDGLV